MKMNTVALMLATSMAYSTGCIHINSRETAKVEIDEDAAGNMLRAGGLKIESLVYTPAKLPLEDFFARLSAGEFTQALREIDLRYQPSKTDNQALQELLAAGLVPVYVRVSNEGRKPVSYRESAFYLTDGASHYPPIASAELPHEFEHFSPVALGVNVYNTGVVVVGVAAMMCVLVLTKGPSLGGFVDPFDAPRGSRKRDDTGSNNQRSKIYNDTTKTTKVDYKDYLLTASTLPPNGSSKGLLFFHLPGGANLDRMALGVGSSGISQKQLSPPLTLTSEHSGAG